MPSEVIVLVWDTPAASDVRAQGIAELMGAPVRVESLVASTATRPDWSANKLHERECLIVDAETLAKLAETGMGGEVLGELVESFSHVFVHGFRATSRHRSLLRALSSGGYVGVQSLPSSPGGRFRVSRNHRSFCGPFSGLSVGAPVSGIDACFETNREAQYQGDILISAEAKPFFVRFRRRDSELWFTACSELADLETAPSDEDGLLPWFSRVVPLMMFLRGALGERVWQNNRPAGCFIIDDPFLKDRYGFLNYHTLIDTMRRQRFSTCIAFIPWNYRRSRKDTADLFASHAPMASLCVHGCDHTRAEFGSVDAGGLYHRSRLALDRMRAHHKRFGVLCDEVMVFPQGVFSSEAVDALNECGYLAAVNSHLCPTNIPGAITLRDAMDVAVTKFSDFPIFSRRYPRDPAEFAFDLFLGKPALVVEHHGYFRDGCERMREFAAQLSALDERLEWTNLATICSQACLSRTTADDEILVRFFTDKFSMHNDRIHTQRYVLFRRCTSRRLPTAITVNGRASDFELHGPDVMIRLALNPGESVNIDVVHTRPSVDVHLRQTATYRARVVLRRLLCEFRDDHVDTSRALARLMSSLRRIRSSTVSAGRHA